MTRSVLHKSCERIGFSFVPFLKCIVLQICVTAETGKSALSSILCAIKNSGKLVLTVSVGDLGLEDRARKEKRSDSAS